MSLHNKQRRLVRTLILAGKTINQYGLIRNSKHGRKRLANGWMKRNKPRNSKVYVEGPSLQVGGKK